MLRRVLAVLAILVVGLIVFGPYEPVAYDTGFETRKLGEGVDVYLESIESPFDNIRQDAEKQVIWAGLKEVPTEISIVYLHGFSASLHEIRPVPDKIAETLGANLVFTRFRGHGRDDAAMAEGSVKAWMHDAAEALAIARTVGRKVVVIGTSTGGTVAALAATEPDLMKDVKGIVFISPNFRINNTWAPLLTFPAARYWLPLVAGRRRSIEPVNAAQAWRWTTQYPTRALIPMAAIVSLARKADYRNVSVPALFYYSDQDQVVDPTATEQVASLWGGSITRVMPELGEGDDPYAHVVAGKILSPGNTDRAVQTILNWISGLP